jgi:hypothetical protein
MTTLLAFLSLEDRLKFKCVSKQFLRILDNSPQKSDENPFKRLLRRLLRAKPPPPLPPASDAALHASLALSIASPKDVKRLKRLLEKSVAVSALELCVTPLLAPSSLLETSARTVSELCPLLRSLSITWMAVGVEWPLARIGRRCPLVREVLVRANVFSAQSLRRLLAEINANFARIQRLEIELNFAPKESRIVSQDFRRLFRLKRLRIQIHTKEEVFDDHFFADFAANLPQISRLELSSARLTDSAFREMSLSATLKSVSFVDSFVRFSDKQKIPKTTRVNGKLVSGFDQKLRQRLFM